MTSSKLPERLDFKKEGEFPWLSIVKRMPTILTQAIDAIHRHINDVADSVDASALADAKAGLATLSKLKHEMATSKPLLRVLDDGVPDDGDDDHILWNAYIDQFRTHPTADLCWFDTHWLLAECYMYRRLAMAQRARYSVVMFVCFLFESEQYHCHLKWRAGRPTICGKKSQRDACVLNQRGACTV
eukprot:m.106559 g.106559  ORF g.106559 m.106559 type:complete len:186 (-) comp16907_c0_seq1:88-645(-)